MSEIVLPAADDHTFKFNEFQLIAYPWTNIISVDGDGNFILGKIFDFNRICLN